MNMQDIDQLQERFGIEGHAEVVEGEGGLARVDVKSREGTGEIYLHGAHVTAFQPAGHDPVLYMSDKSNYADGKAIRGGIPIIFPWFGPHPEKPEAPQHGFSRARAWELKGTRRTKGGIEVELGLDVPETLSPFWPHACEVRFTARFGRDLDLVMDIRNTSNAPFECEVALHTYLEVGDVRQASIEGLAGRTFIDKTRNMERRTLGDGPLVLDGETDRVFLATDDLVKVHDPVKKRCISVAKVGSQSTVIWNPWSEKAQSLKDLAEDTWPRFVCVETCNAADDARVVEPGGFHRLIATIQVTRE